MVQSRAGSARIDDARGDGSGPSRRSVLSQALTVLLPAGVVSACSQDQMLVSRFIDIPRLVVPPGIRLVHTQGWGRPGIGAAIYVYDPRVDRDRVKAMPRSAVVSANGRGFALHTLPANVCQFGALGDGLADDSAAINAALAQGGDVVLPGPATYRVTGRLLMSVARSRLILEDGATLQIQAWRYTGSQIPFGNAIHVTADDCEIIGLGPRSMLISSDSDANGVGFLHCSGGRVAGLVIRGGKHTIDAITDDTFQSGISVINASGSNPSRKISSVVIENCEISGWAQYGVNIYGDLASQILLRGNRILDCGISADPLSVGAGIALTRGVGPIRIEHNRIAENKGCGVFVSSAGQEIRDVTISGNVIVDNHREGICLSEERQFGSVATIGQRDVKIQGNQIGANGEAGLRAGTYHNVGSIQRLLVQDNLIWGNAGPGILLQANIAAERGVEARIITNDLADNGEFGLVIGRGAVSFSLHDNIFRRNRLGDGIDYSQSEGARPIEA